MALEQVDSHLVRPWQEAVAIVAARDNNEDAGGKDWQRGCWWEGLAGEWGQGSRVLWLCDSVVGDSSSAQPAGFANESLLTSIQYRIGA